MRGIREAVFQDLAPLTILLGPNGCGKSTVLEAVGVVCAGGDGEGALRALAGREGLGTSAAAYWFSEAKLSSTVDGEERSVVLRHARPPSGSSAVFELSGRTASNPWSAGAQLDATGVAPLFRGVPFRPFALLANVPDRRANPRDASSPSALRDALGRLKLSPLYDTFFAYLQKLRPELVSIESLPVGERDEPFLFEGKPRVGYPLAYAGDGFRRALLFAATLAEAKGGVAALDEPEAYAHPRMFDALTGLLASALDDGTQVFAATHSLEFVRACAEAFASDLDRLAVVAMHRDRDTVDAVTLRGPDVFRRVVELADDLRL